VGRVLNLNARVLEIGLSEFLWVNLVFLKGVNYERI
jgi:hypothetical protein